MVTETEPSSEPVIDSTFNELILIRIIFGNWLKILLVSFLAGLVVTLYSLILPNIFSSSSSLIINAPETPFWGEVEPLDPEALRILSTSVQIKHNLFTSATQQGIIDPKIDFTEFQKNLSASVHNQQRGRDQEVLPLIELSAKSKEPKVASQLANIWADLILLETRRIYQAGVEEYFVFANRSLSGVEEDLSSTEDKLTSISLQSNIELLKREIENGTETYARVFDKLQNLSEKVVTQKAQILTLKQLKAEQSIDGVWYGNYLMQDKIKKIILNGQELPKNLESEIALRIFESAKRIIVNQASMAEIEEEYNLDLLTDAYNYTQTAVTSLTASQINDDIVVAELREKDRLLDEMLKKTSPRIFLKKAITNDAYWQAHLSEAKNLEQSDKSFLVTEEINPEFISLQNEKSEVYLQLKSKETSLKKTHEVVDDLKNKLGPLKSQLLKTRERHTAILSELESNQAFITFLNEKYEKILQDIETLESDLRNNKAMLETNQAFFTRISNEQSKRQNIVRQAEDRIANLERERESLLETRQGLAQKTREVHLLKISATNGSRSGVAVFFRAEPNSSKIEPNRSKMVLFSMVITALLVSAYLTFNYILRHSTEAEST